jgi:7,8-dihydropterin-6-yl-methyl-4-(beta-D-ribofuranosyl)aminobenzene 5'-phosphate synthase
MRVLGGSAICCAHHGLSLLLRVRGADGTHDLLFDAGPEEATFLRNAALLGIDFGAIESVVLSHGHWDHAGGLPAAIAQIARARGGQRVTCHVHPGMFVHRGIRLPSGVVLPMADVASPEALAGAGAAVVNTAQPQLVGEGGAFYLSGEIPRRTAYETGFPNHVCRTTDDGDWEPDPLIMDERFLAVHVRGVGQVIFSACSHGGIVNVLTHARTLFPDVQLHGVFGGLHLAGVTEAIIPQTVADLQELAPRMLAPGHCTGWRALERLHAAFGDRVIPLAVGKRFVIGGGAGA